MKQKQFTSLGFIILLMMTFFCCETDIEKSNSKVVASAGSNNSNARVAGSFFEDFESGTKTAYAAADVTLSTGSWNFSDALIGNSSSDRKNGLQSVRIRNTGIISMNFNITSGASTVNVLHAAFGTDGGSTWQLWVSTNGGSTYAQVGSTVTTSSTTLSIASFAVNITGNARFQVRKISGGANRINIDEFEIVPNGGSSGSGADDSNMLFGNPSGATNNVANENNFLMDKTYYITSYNRSKATPNWVCWHLDPSSLGSTARQDDFRADTTLPTGWYEVQNTSYSGSGFDRGHNCPSADRTSTVTANSATFLMTNMIPQAPNNNQHTWANLESYERTLVNNGNEVYIIMGSYGIGGTGSNGSANTINGGQVTVPSHVWKVILVLTQGSNDLGRVTTSTRVIAVDTPNVNTVNSDWSQYRTTVDAIETATGFDILSALPTGVQATLESVVDSGPIM